MKNDLCKKSFLDDITDGQDVDMHILHILQRDFKL